MICQRALLFGALFFLGGKALDLVNDGVDFLMQKALGILQREEFPFPRCNRHFLCAQLGLGVLQAGVQSGLFTLQSPLRATDFRNAHLQFRQGFRQRRDLVFPPENRRRGFAVRLSVVLTARKNTVAAQDFTTQGHIIDL